MQSCVLLYKNHAAVQQFDFIIIIGSFSSAVTTSMEIILNSPFSLRIAITVKA